MRAARRNGSAAQNRLLRWKGCENGEVRMESKVWKGAKSAMCVMSLLSVVVVVVVGGRGWTSTRRGCRRGLYAAVCVWKWRVPMGSGVFIRF